MAAGSAATCLQPAISHDDTSEQDMTVPEPTGQPDLERPIDLTDTPDQDNPGPTPTPEHHPDDAGRPGDDSSTPNVTSVD
jgi:hypothetical protein